MSCRRDGFSFLEGVESADAVKLDVIEFLDGSEWCEFVEAVCNESVVALDRQVRALVKRIRGGLVSADAGLKMCDQKRVLEAMGMRMDVEMLEIVLGENAKGSKTAACMLESLARCYPSEFVSAIEKVTMVDTVRDSLVVVVLGVFLRHQYRSLRKFLAGIPIGCLVHGLYQWSRGAAESELKVCADFLLQLNGEAGFLEAVHDAVVCAEEDESGFFLEVVLEFLEVGQQKRIFNYSDVFGVVFRNCEDILLQNVLEKRAETCDAVILQIQIECIDKRYSEKLKDILAGKQQKEERALSEAEFIRLAEEFKRTKVLPTPIIRAAMSQKRLLNNYIEPTIRSLANHNEAVEAMLREMEKAKIVQSLDKYTPIDVDSAIVDKLEQSPEAYAHELFNLFHRGVFSRHPSQIASFTDEFERNILRRLSYTTQEILAEIIVEFLCSELQSQHRWSLSILSGRCLISKHIQKIFECSCPLEVEILVYLHKGAIAGSTSIRIEGIRQKSANPGVLDIESDSSTVMAALDHNIIQRLRWRVLRGDSTDSVCWLPEFLSLCDSDLVLFLRWECAERPSISVAEILSRIGVTTSASLYPKFLFEMLRSDPPDEICSVMIPLFSNITMESIKLPENPNMNLLFRTRILWCSGVLCHPAVISYLRNPTPEISQALLSSLPLESNIEQLFSIFPHAFAAMLYNFSALTGTKPRCLCDAYHMVEGKFNVYPDAPKFAIVSIVSAFARKGGSILSLAKAMGSQNWVNYCLFFALCLHQNDVAIELLQHFDFLFHLLRQGIAEENLFFGQGKWTDSLIEFAIYCAHHDVSFAEVEEWRQFLNCVRLASWPDRLALDNENLCILRKYSSKYV